MHHAGQRVNHTRFHFELIRDTANQNFLQHAGKKKKYHKNNHGREYAAERHRRCPDMNQGEVHPF